MHLLLHRFFSILRAAPPLTAGATCGGTVLRSKGRCVRHQTLNRCLLQVRLVRILLRTQDRGARMEIVRDAVSVPGVDPGFATSFPPKP